GRGWGRGRSWGGGMGGVGARGAPACPQWFNLQNAEEAKAPPPPPVAAPIPPVPLSADTLRPGTVYADPYGHILMIVRRIAQTEDAAGIILAVDGQPDGTVARKRFWRGNFLFAQDPALGGPGFKRFRPVVVANGAMRRSTNAEIAKNPQYADFSLDQSQLGVEDFYDRMDDVMSPSPLDPTRAMKEAITSLEEQAK